MRCPPAQDAGTPASARRRSARSWPTAVRCTAAGRSPRSCCRALCSASAAGSASVSAMPHFLGTGDERVRARLPGREVSRGRRLRPHERLHQRCCSSASARAARMRSWPAYTFTDVPRRKPASAGPLSAARPTAGEEGAQTAASSAMPAVTAFLPVRRKRPLTMRTLPRSGSMPERRPWPTTLVDGVVAAGVLPEAPQRALGGEESRRCAARRWCPDTRCAARRRWRPASDGSVHRAVNGHAPGGGGAHGAGAGLAAQAAGGRGGEVPLQ